MNEFETRENIELRKRRERVGRQPPSGRRALKRSTDWEDCGDEIQRDCAGGRKDGQARGQLSHCLSQGKITRKWIWRRRKPLLLRGAETFLQDIINCWTVSNCSLRDASRLRANREERERKKAHCLLNRSESSCQAWLHFYESYKYQTQPNDIMIIFAI